MKRIVVFGRTGAGKSSLGNKIFGSENFKEGHTLFSETSESKEKVFNWPRDPSLQVSFIDTPGFADNRPNTSNQQILNNIFKLLKDLKGGFHVGIFCIAAKSRIDSYDMDEIKLLQMILGSGLFDHLWIAITQINTFEEQVKAEYYQKIPIELPQVLKASSIPLSSDRVLFADFSDFENQFLNTLDRLIHESPSYQPENVIKLEQDEQNGNNFLNSLAMQTILQKYGEMFSESKDQLAKAIEQMKKLGSTNAALQKQMQKKEEDMRRLQEKMEEINSLKQGQGPNTTTTIAATTHNLSKGPVVDIGNLNHVKNRSDPLDECAWKANESFRLSEGNRIAEHIGENKFRTIIAEKSLESRNSKWIITINKQSGFFSNLTYCLTPGYPMFGIQDADGNIYSISYQGCALTNMRNTDSFRSAKIQNNSEFICELDRDEGIFRISVSDLVIAINRNPLKSESKFYVFACLWKGNTAVIKPLVYI